MDGLRSGISLGGGAARDEGAPGPFERDGPSRVGRGGGGLSWGGIGAAGLAETWFDEDGRKET